MNKKIKRKSVGTGFSMCVQPAFIIGTNNEDGTPNFAPITWVSATCEKGSDYFIVISMFGTKNTKTNVYRDKRLSVNLVSTDMLPLMDYFGTHHAKVAEEDDIEYSFSRGEVVDVPTLDASPWVYECEVEKSVEIGESTTFFCRIKNIQMDEKIECKDTFDVNLVKFDPVIYSGNYHSLGKRLGEIGDYANRDNKRKSMLETTLNTRDLGGYRVEGTETFTKYNRLIRSDAPTMPSERDIDFLRRIGITTIIDTRIDEEIERKAHGLSTVQGFDYYNFPITEGSGLPESVEAVPNSYFACAHDPSIAKIFKTIAEADGAVMYNCSAGKDRTGVNSALILWLCGVSKDDIVRDYMYTKENNASRFGRIRENFPDIDINIVIPHEEYMYGFIDLMEKAHGTIEAFFESIGIDASMQKKLRSKLLDA